MQFVTDRGVCKHIADGMADMAPQELRLTVHEYCRRLAIKMTEDGMPKVQYTFSPNAVFFGDNDEWAM
jgi:hypothetical protein